MLTVEGEGTLMSTTSTRMRSQDGEQRGPWVDHTLQDKGVSVLFILRRVGPGHNLYQPFQAGRGMCIWVSPSYWAGSFGTSLF